MKYFYLRRSDGSVVEIPERDLESTMKRNKSWTIITDDLEPNEVKAEEVKGLGCPLCDFVAKSEFGLGAHRRSKHK